MAHLFSLFAKSRPWIQYAITTGNDAAINCEINKSIHGLSRSHRTFQWRNSELLPSTMETAQAPLVSPYSAPRSRHAVLFVAPRSKRPQSRKRRARRSGRLRRRRPGRQSRGAKSAPPDQTDGDRSLLTVLQNCSRRVSSGHPSAAPNPRERPWLNCV
jgi:hypothetical protein